MPFANLRTSSFEGMKVARFRRSLFETMRENIARNHNGPPPDERDIRQRIVRGKKGGGRRTDKTTDGLGPGLVADVVVARRSFSEREIERELITRWTRHEEMKNAGPTRAT